MNILPAEQIPEVPRASGFLRVVVAYGYGIREDDSIWNDDLPSFFRRHDGRAGLYVGNIPLNSRNADEIT
jgi:hypothetical protein